MVLKQTLVQLLNLLIAVAVQVIAGVLCVTVSPLPIHQDGAQFSGTIKGRVLDVEGQVCVWSHGLCSKI